jgi:DNA-binding beta-propeller fold protein YncE
MRRFLRRPPIGWVVILIVFAALILCFPAPGVALGESVQGPVSGMIGSIPLLGLSNAWAPVYDGANGNLYVSGFWSVFVNGTVSIISGATNQIVATATVGWEPNGPTVDSDNGDVYVANSDPGCTNCPAGMWYGPQNVTVISGVTNHDIANIQPVPSPTSVTLDPSNGNLYVPDDNGNPNGNGTVTVLSGATNRVLGSVSVGQYPTEMLYDGSNGDLYVLDEFSVVGSQVPDQVTVVSGSTNTAIGTLSLLGTATGLELLDPSNGNVYIGGSNGISVISGTTNKVVQTLSLPGIDAGFVDAEGDVYLMQPGNLATVSMVSGATDAILSTFSVGSAGAMTYDPTNGYLYTTNLGFGNSILNVTSLASQKQVQSLHLSEGSGAWALDGPVYDPGNGDLYVEAQGPGVEIAIISTNEMPSSGSSPLTSNPLLLFGIGAGAGALVLGAGILVLRAKRRHKEKKT